MFQTFQITASPEQGPPRIHALRAHMAQAGLDAVLVPQTDAYRGEDIAPCDARLAWLTGFTGSAGAAIVTASQVALFVDGRYRVQGRNQCDEMISIVHWPETSWADWAAGALPAGAVLGLDPWLHTKAEIEALEAKLTPAGATLRKIDNPVDAIWDDRPAPPEARFFHHPEALAGEAETAKRARIGASLSEAGQSAVLLTLPDSIAWLLNIRGADLSCTPVPQAFALLHADGRTELFAHPGKADDLSLPDAVTCHPPEALEAQLAAVEGPIRLDPQTAPAVLFDMLGDKAQAGPDPVILPKALKNPTEIAGMREAHLRDATAMIRFLHWLDETAPGGLSEIDVVRKLEAFRADTGALRDISFETICGSGPHGAIIHYRVTEESDRALQEGELLLVDSGGQYADGTTDITRTMAIGTPDDEHRLAYTLVLRGLIDVGEARFPAGTTGAAIDTLARMPLWRAGRDYDHGTGHGVGAYLSVHEGPQRIAKGADVALQPGMILSNEPGYYRPGAYGIRLENLIVTRDAEDIPGEDDRGWLDFETLTFVPFDRRLIRRGLLSPPERDWIDRYHADILTRLSPRLSDDGTKDWLRRACAPL